MLTRRSWFVYVALLAVWVILIGWQVAEHLRFMDYRRAMRIRDAVSWSNNLGLLLRSQQRGPTNSPVVLITEQLQSSLKQIINLGAFHSVLLLNATNGLVASVGTPIDPELKERLLGGEITEDRIWDDQAQTVTLLNLVDLGTNIVVLPLSERFPAFGFNTNTAVSSGSTNVQLATTNSTPPSATTNASASGETNLARNFEREDPPRGFGRRGRPPRITPEMIQNKGVHNFIIAMSTQQMLYECRRDFWIRIFIAVLATLAVAGTWLAWANLNKTSELQIRLVRASELNSHLKEMNLAAAGLAHETRNPLNIVRGLAQMISRRDDASPEIRAKTREMIDETDRITAQLNEFINYSRPREVRRAATNLGSVVTEVVRALNFDVEEKKVQLQVLTAPLTIQADEQLLRQALFNLVLNAIQAIPSGGVIQIRSGKRNGAEAWVEVADNGPGVAPEHRSELFKPYFTTHQEGTGLGLAVVQQIVLAHGWEIECLPNQPSGALFRITHIRAVH